MLCREFLAVRGVLAMFNCRNCKAEIDDDDLDLCPYCGSEAQTREEWEKRNLAKQRAIEKKNKRHARAPIVKIVVMSVSAALIVMGGIGHMLYEVQNKVDKFEYEDTAATVNTLTKGVLREGFENQGEETVDSRDEAIEAAKREIHFEYDNLWVAYDNDSDVWRVTFSPKAGGAVTVVYIEGNGKTAYVLSESNS